MNAKTLCCRDVRLICADADAYRFPRGPLVVYLFNPFDASVLSSILERLAAGPQRDLALVYHTPVEREIIEAHPAFEFIAEDRVGAVYRRKPA
jgi:hypothetical protein